MKWPKTKDEFFEKANNTVQGIKERFQSSTSSINIDDIFPDSVVDKYDDTIDNIQTVSSISRDVIITKLLFNTTEGNVILGTFCAVSFVIGFKFGRLQPIWKRYTQISDISNIGSNSPLLRGKVMSVSDGDTIRFLHSPIPMFSTTKLADNEKLSDTALPIRICTIDTPETKKFGKEGQPYGEEAKQYLSNLILDQIVFIRLLSKDQYGRGVGQVIKKRKFPLNVVLGNYNIDEYMLNSGLAEVYRGNGAVYGPKGKDKYIQMEEKAKKSKIGMWSNNNRESAAEYKARMKKENNK